MGILPLSLKIRSHASVENWLFNQWIVIETKVANEHI